MRITVQLVAHCSGVEVSDEMLPEAARTARMMPAVFCASFAPAVRVMLRVFLSYFKPLLGINGKTL
jgi:hypothetical protein